jgi:hypothetical protein
MNLASEREYLAGVLAPLGTAHEYLPERLNPPCLILTPADPYVTSGKTFGTATVHFDITFVAKVAPAATTAPVLDKTLDGLVAALLAAGYSVEEIGAPFVLNANNAQYPAVTVTASNPTDL